MSSGSSGASAWASTTSWPARAQRARHAEHRAERVAVGVVVRGDHEALARAGQDLGHLRGGGMAAGPCAHPSSSSVPAVISSMRRLSATASRCVLS